MAGLSAPRSVSAWGRLSAAPHAWQPLQHRGEVPAALAAPGPTGIAHGMGRSYGDEALAPGGRLWATRALDRLIDFDPEAGLLEAEAGITLGEIADWALPRGWFLPVMPGTQYVTLGGAIANDVHGKNHHRVGSFGHHVEAVELVRSDGRMLRCSAQANADWLAASIGGMGLTGVITSARLRLQKVAGPWIEAETLRLSSLADFIAASEAALEAAHPWPYSVAWFDATRPAARFRGLLFRGRHVADAHPLPARRVRRLGLTPPASLVNRLTARAFGELYLRLNPGGPPRRQAWPGFFCPLDGLADWNRAYGPAGFFQYQCVLPRAVQQDATAELLERLARSGHTTFLGVLKSFGEQAPAGLMSFAMPGITVAVDLPNLGARTERLFGELDAVVASAGGRLYAAKDARMPRALFEAGYPRLAEFVRYRDPALGSAMSRRLMGT